MASVVETYHAVRSDASVDEFFKLETIVANAIDEEHDAVWGCVRSGIKVFAIYLSSVAVIHVVNFRLEGWFIIRHVRAREVKKFEESS